MNILQRGLIKLVRGYQLVLSPLVGFHCRFQPTCSEYMIEAIRSKGALKGCFIGVKRLLRCHPWGGHGYDPMESKSNKDPNLSSNLER